MTVARLKLGAQAFAVALVVGLLALLVWKLVSDPGGGVSAALQRGERPSAPNFTLDRLGSQEKLSLASFDGKPRVLDFFASWCYACPYESKRIEKAVHEYGNQIVFIGIATKDFGPDARRYVRRYHLTYPIVHDGNGKVLDQWGGMPIPRIFFVDRQGKVIGQMEAEEDLPRFLRKLAAEV
jgi:cytochrome c biogenesis protein CcmG, thiol:disulfide interchange protein DsbE